jgi:hypothetical protein
VTVAENFQVKMPEPQPNQGLPPEFAPGQQQAQPVEPAENPHQPQSKSSPEKTKPKPRKQ